MKALHCALFTSLLLGPTALADTLTYFAYLTGGAESPPNASPGTGTATVTLDTTAHQLIVSVMFSDLLGTTTASHIHCCTASPGTGTAGVATVTPTFTGFPLGVTSGSYSHTFDTTLAGSWNPAFVAANGGTPLSAEAVLASGILAGDAYLNVHSTSFPGGEIRGFLAPVPEPGSAMLLLSIGLAVGLLRRLAPRT